MCLLFALCIGHCVLQRPIHRPVNGYKVLNTLSAKQGRFETKRLDPFDLTIVESQRDGRVAEVHGGAAGRYWGFCRVSIRNRISAAIVWSKSGASARVRSRLPVTMS